MRTSSRRSIPRAPTRTGTTTRPRVAARRARRGRPRRDRHGARGGPQAAHVPRLVPVLRPRVRLGRGRGDPAVGLRGADAAGSRETDRSDPRRGTSPRSSAPKFPSPVLEQIAAETGATYVDDLRDDDLPGRRATDHSYLGLMVFDYRTIVGGARRRPGRVRSGRRVEPPGRRGHGRVAATDGTASSGSSASRAATGGSRSW